MEDRRKEREELRRKRQRRVRLQWCIVAVILVLIAGFVASRTWNTPEPPPGTEHSGKLEASLVGDLTVTLEFGTAYTDPGVTVTWDGEPVEAEVKTQLPDLTVLGARTVGYTVSYKDKTLTLERTVTVVDTQPPVLTLIELPGHITEIGQPYVDEGCTAVDNYDGDISHKVIAVQNGDVVTYTVTDSSGNTATAERTIVYGDTTAPVITLVGGETVTIPAGTEFQEPGFSAQDNADGDVTAAVTVTGEYDRYIPGSYTMTYTVTDKHGNTATAIRTLVVEGLTQPDTVIPGGKVIYLTFDDGPSQYTPQLLQVLERYNVKATFFVVCKYYPQYLDDIAAGGHSIGIHSNTHEYSEIYSSEEAFFADFNAARETIHEYTGIWTTLCRFPGGSGNRTSKKYCPGLMTRLTKAVEAQGYQYFDWNVVSGDAGETKSTDQVFKNVVDGVSGKNYAIVLQHDIFKYSVDAVERIIQWGLANGYTFLPLDPTSPTCHQKIMN